MNFSSENNALTGNKRKEMTCEVNSIGKQFLQFFSYLSGCGGIILKAKILK